MVSIGSLIKNYTLGGIIYDKVTSGNNNRSVSETVKETVKDTAETVKDTTVKAASDGWETVKDTATTVKDEWQQHAGLTIIDTAYNFATGKEGKPSQIRNTISSTVTNVVDAAQGLGDDAIKAAKKYWPFAAASVVGLVLLKSATPAVVSNLMKKK